jgi:phosphatidylserine/phosphatidylglycerophosphate/cardiolipin synthase-like enzyme
VHFKLLLIDDAWLAIGSANAMDRSFERDTELNLAVWSRALARGLGRRSAARAQARGSAQPFSASKRNSSSSGRNRSIAWSIEPISSSWPGVNSTFRK